MKQKFLLSLTMMLLCIFATNGQVSSMRLGYSNGEVATKGQIGMSGENTIEVAIYLTKEQLSIHSGNQIESIKAGLATKLNIATLNVWIRSELFGENIAEGTAESIKKGWNDIMLSSPYTIQGDKGLYIGYTFSQNGSAYGISTVGSYVENGLFVKLGADADWTSPTEYGVASVEAMVVGENLPKFDLTLLSVSTKENYPLGTPMPITIEVRNVASYTITGFDVECQIDGIDTIVTHIDCSLEYDTESTFDFDITPALTELKNNTKMVVTIANLTEGEDQLPSDNSLELMFNVINKEFKRNLLVEEFTTERCPNCPTGAYYLHDALEIIEEEFPGQTNVVCHHSGFYTDWLTAKESEDLLWLFNSGGSTYAPAFMADRTGVWSNPGIEEMAEIFRKRLNTPSYVGIEISSEYNPEERLLDVTVTGERSMIFCENDPRIVVYAVENDIKARNQAGAPTTETYIHNHALRVSNAAFGEKIEWAEDNTFKYSCTLKINSSWITNNMEIIAFVSDYNSSDATSCVVENSAMCKFTDFYYDSVEETLADAANVYVVGNSVVVEGEYDAFEVYAVNGQCVAADNLPAGVYIVRVNTANSSRSHKIIVK